MKISAILLGAGESKRMGKDKLFLPWGRTTVLEHCLKVLLRSRAGEVIVVLQESKGAIGEAGKSPKVKVVNNPDYLEGMSSSIRKGVRVADPKSAGILIAFGDMPFIRPQTINALIRAFEKAKRRIVVPMLHGRRGHPVIFPRTYEGELLRLEGDTGGRAILMKHPEAVLTIPVQSEGVLRDLDTWTDYEGALKKRPSLRGKINREGATCHQTKGYRNGSS